MGQRRIVIVALFGLFLSACSRTPQSVVEDVAQKTGATGLKTIQYSGTGSAFRFGLSYEPTEPWPKLEMKSYTRVVDYEKGAWQDNSFQEQFANRPRDDRPQPEFRFRNEIAAFADGHAWNVIGDGAPAAAHEEVEERQLQAVITPLGWVKAAMTANPTMESANINGKEVTAISFTVQGNHKVKGYVNAENLLEKVETWVANPLFGDMLIETNYSDYRDFSGVMFPGKILQNMGGFPVLDLTVSEVKPNAPVNIEVPEEAKQPPTPHEGVKTKKVADGLWYLAGGSHTSMVLEFNDHVVVFDCPGEEERSLEVMAEVKKLVPGKPIRYVINSHHDPNHSGGIRTYVAEGVTVVTHAINKEFYERIFQTPHTLEPDRLFQNPKPATFLTVENEHTLTDGTRSLVLYQVKDNIHNAGLLMAYLPKEKILMEADSWSPRAPNIPYPPPNLMTLNLADNIERLKLDVQYILPTHGRMVPIAELRRAIMSRR